MNQIFIITLFVMKISAKLQMAEDQYAQFIQLFYDAVKYLFLDSNIRFELIFYGYSRLDNISHLTDNLLKKISENKIPIEGDFVIKEVRSWSHVFRQSALIFRKSVNHMKKLHIEARLSSQTWKILKFLIFVENMKIDDFEFVPLPLELTPDSGHISLYEYILVREKSQLFLVTTDWFTVKLCNIVQFIPVNYFNLKTREWRKNLKKIEKFKNFNRCLLVIGSEYSMFENAYVDKIDGQIKGFLHDLFKIIADRGNFTIYHQFMTQSLDENNVMRDGFIVMNNKTMNLNVFPTTKSCHLPSFHTTTSFLQFDHIFVLSATEKFTNFEKMVMPFDELIWLFLFLTFTAAFTVIFIVNRLPYRFQEIVYGVGVKMPAFNIVGTFFGIRQTKLPKANFPRMILIIFVLFCLIIRSAYQGVFYDIFATDMRKPLIKTIEQLYERDFVICSLYDQFTIPLYEMIPEDKR